MIQYSICFLGIFISALFSWIFVRYDNQNFGYICFMISITFLIAAVARFFVNDFTNVLNCVLTFIQWLVKG